ncbi:MAG: carbohydrate binding family 9 domain-containing protein, partial [Gemmatimonadaceae bacterium]|nr:carbohydrate binding family 9 domain-containing protein [Gemmatimonadaceae bacterium]
MVPSLLLALQVAGAAPVSARPAEPVATPGATAPGPDVGRRVGEVFSGRAGTAALAAPAPKSEDSLRIDGVLDEPVWAEAVRLTGFSTYNPVDGRPSRDSTDVLVWYSSTAIHFGIRAYAPPGQVQATLADRDRITNDDWVQILLDTFNDKRRAFMFAVNPLGIQSDGMRSEGAAGPGVNRAALVSSDLSQDFIWSSKGRITDWGYEVELRIPFKSLRFQAGRTQDWGIQIIRNTQKTGYQDTWAPVKRAGASFQVQSGRLTGLTELKRGLVLDVTPVTTAFANGAPPPTGAATNDWRYVSRGQFGADVRWGVTPNLTMNATAFPDFSQVEADVGQIPGDVRFALFFPELRPFFTEGSEQFDSPGRLVYTRQIVQPVAAAKLTGKLTRADLGVLAAVDGAQYSADGRTNPLFGIVRYRKDLGVASNAGLVFTERNEGGAFNRVLSTDARIFLTPIYTLNYSLGGSWTGTPQGAGGFAPNFDFGLGRTGRGAGFLYGITGISDRFEARAGFVPRNDFVEPRIFQRFSFFSTPGSWWDQLTLFVASRALWNWNGFGRELPLEQRVSVSNSLTFKGGWNASVIPGFEWFRFDPARYADYRVLTTGIGGGAALPFTPGRTIAARYVRADVRTPQFRRFGVAGGFALSNAEPDFFETDIANRFDWDITADLRPTPQIRAQALWRHSQFTRRRDGTRLLTTTIPRLRLEYQLNRWVFFRFVGQYERRFRDALRDPATGFPIGRVQSDGTVAQVDALNSNRLRADWLFSFLPNPGTVVFAGYGSTLTEDDAFSFRRMERQQD